MNLVSVNLKTRSGLGDFAIDAEINKTYFSVLLEQLPVMPFARLHQWRKHCNLFARKTLFNHFGNARIGILHHGFAGMHGICC
ncbi:hypothetical protein DSECCO2_594950 [anaerobic digester metagenome]